MLNLPCDKVHGTWEESSFSDTEHDTADDESCEVLYDAGEGHDDTPRDNENADVC